MDIALVISGPLEDGFDLEQCNLICGTICQSRLTFVANGVGKPEGLEKFKRWRT